MYAPAKEQRDLTKGVTTATTLKQTCSTTAVARFNFCVILWGFMYVPRCA